MWVCVLCCPCCRVAQSVACGPILSLVGRAAVRGLAAGRGCAQQQCLEPPLLRARQAARLGREHSDKRSQVRDAPQSAPSTQQCAASVAHRSAVVLGPLSLAVPPATHSIGCPLHQTMRARGTIYRGNSSRQPTAHIRGPAAVDTAERDLTGPLIAHLLSNLCCYRCRCRCRLLLLPACSTAIKQHMERRAVQLSRQQPDCHFALSLLVDVWTEQWDGATELGNRERRTQASQVRPADTHPANKPRDTTER